MSETNVTTLPVAIPQPAPRREVRVVNDPIPVLDTGRFEQMQRIAQIMATCTLMPTTLYTEKDNDGNIVWLSEREVFSNCFMVVNQAVRWGMDPFAVAQCVSFIHGKLCYEGKLIAAVIKAKLGYDLEYKIEGQGENMKVTVSAALDGKPVVDSQGRLKAVEGTVSEWKTTSAGSPWNPAKGGYARMLRYRGAREWGRVYSPELMLGVYSDDEIEENDLRFRGARNITPETSSYEETPSLPPRRVPPPSADKPTENGGDVSTTSTGASSSAPTGELKETSGETQKEVTKTVTPSGPPRKVPDPKETPKPQEEPKPQPQASAGWPDPKEEPSQFLLKVKEMLLQCKDGEDASHLFVNEIQDRAGDLYEDAMKLFGQLNREKFGEQ